jgi:hypothetical protein
MEICDRGQARSVRARQDQATTAAPPMILIRQSGSEFAEDTSRMPLNPWKRVVIVTEHRASGQEIAIRFGGVESRRELHHAQI